MTRRSGRQPVAAGPVSERITGVDAHQVHLVAECYFFDLAAAAGSKTSAATNPAAAIPPARPAQVLFGLIMGASFGPPILRPAKSYRTRALMTVWEIAERPYRQKDEEQEPRHADQESFPFCGLFHFPLVSKNTP